ncbi:MAG: 4Fe-4S dicluster domain-containing protein [Desulfovibrionaceae bacterium]
MPARYAFLIDSHKCTGCHACVMACKNYNQLAPYQKWRIVYALTEDVYPFEGRAFYSLGCNHCEDPACLKVCPVGAYSIRRDGIVVHDYDQCVGCGRCVRSCPYEVPTFDPGMQKTHKCNMCYERIDKGLQPFCVQACTTGGLSLIDLHTTNYTIQYPARFPYRPELNPSTRFLLPRVPRLVML